MMHALPKPSVKRWVLAVTVLFAGVFLNCLAQAVIDRFVPNYSPDRVLPDLGFAVLPLVPFTTGINLTAALMMLSVVVGMWITYGRLFNLAFYVFVQQIGAIFLLRGGSIVLTLLPTPLPGCVSTGLEHHVVVRAFRILFGLDVTCADVFFSGHAANMMLALLAWYYFIQFPALWRRTLLVLASAMTIVFCALLIASRFHYTLDVFYGILVAVVVWRGWSEYDGDIQIIRQSNIFGSFNFWPK
jgi:hypothetical protein